MGLESASGQLDTVPRQKIGESQVITLNQSDMFVMHIPSGESCWKIHHCIVPRGELFIVDSVDSLHLPCTSKVFHSPCIVDVAMI